MTNPEHMHPKITITGDLGSGKSVVSKQLEAELRFEIYSTGKVQREIADRHGMTTLALNQYAETHPEIDEEIDSVFVQLAKRPVGLIVDSRLAWFFMPDSFKVYMKVPLEVAATRIMQDDSRKREKYRDLAHAMDDLSARKNSENTRFMEKYGADCANMNNFDLVIDTSLFTPTEVASEIANKFQQWAANGVV